jgi:O-acetylserine/cysteine efflux transporter
MRPADVAVAVFVMSIWGMNFVVAKVGLAELPPILFMLLRFSIVAALLAPFARLPSTRQFRRIALISVTMGGLHFPMMFTGLAGVDASLAAIAVQLQVPFAAALAALIYRDPLGWKRAAGMALAFAGVVLIAGEPRETTDLVSLGIVIVGGFMWSIGNIQIKELGPIDGIQLTAWTAILAVPQLLLGTLLIEDGQLAAIAAASPLAWGTVAYQALAVAIFSYILWYPIVRRYPVNRTMPFILLQPVFGVVGAVALLGEPLSLPLVLGGAMVVAGVAAVLLLAPRPAQQPSAEAGTAPRGN